MIRCIWLTTLCCVLLSPPVHPQDIQNELPFHLAVNKLLERNKLGLDEAVNRELALLKDLSSLSDEQIASLKPKLKPLIKKNRGTFGSTSKIPADEILQAIEVFALRVVNDAELVAIFREDLDRRLKFEQEMFVQTSVFFVDCFVGLSADQWETVRSASSKQFRSGKRGFSSLVLDDAKLTSPELQDLRESLNEKQLTYLQKFVPEWDGDVNAKELTPAFQLLAEMKLRQLDSVVGLTEQQRNKLEFVGKRTVVPKAIERRITVKEDFGRFALALAGKGPAIANAEVFDAMNLSDQRLPFFFPEERWQSFVSAVLTAEQAEAWREFSNRRTEAAIDAQASSALEYLCKLPLSSKQQTAAHKLIRRAVRSRGPRLQDAFVGVFNPNNLGRVTTQQEFKSAIGVKNWASLDDFSRQAISTMMRDRP